MLNKKIALSIVLTAAALPVLAQSSVQMYGRLNTSIEQQKLGGQMSSGIFNNSSRIGFKGVEEFGQGIKAGFILESGFGSDTGAGTNQDRGLSFNRQSELFMESSAGMLRLGNFTSESYFSSADMISMHNHDTGSSADALYTWITRDTNKISYRTPTFSNKWVEIAHAFHEKQLSSTGYQDKNTWDIAANHTGANFGLGAGFTDNGYDRQLSLRANYNAAQWRLGAYVQRVEISNQPTGSTEMWNNYRLSAAYVLRANEFHANIGYADRDNRKSAKQWTVGVNHNLSKRTKIYAFYSKIDNAANASYGYGINSTLNTGPVSTGHDFHSFAMGLRHNF